MSRFFSRKYERLIPYVPGEQPRDRQFVKLNTNESPFPPSPKAVEAAKREAERLQLYSDPEARLLREKLAALCGVTPEQVIVTNGSDEVLNFAFMAFCDANRPAVFPDVTYGFYPVFANVNGVPYREIPLLDDFSVDVPALCRTRGTVFLANPNAPTGIALPRDTVETILRAHPDEMVIVDEAYVDFGAESCLPLVEKYENLLVTQTFSKSRSMAGARLGFGVGQATVIRDLETLRNSTNPYNVNRMTLAAGVGALEDEDYTRANCDTVVQNRTFTAVEMEKLGFEVIPSSANFLFVKHPRVGGADFYRSLREKGVLVRHFAITRLQDYNRVTVGSREQMEALLGATREILEELK